MPLTAVTDRGRTLLLGRARDYGSEGVVYEIAESPGLLAKLLLQPHDPAESGRRLASLVRQGRSPRTARLRGGNPPRAAWPVATIRLTGLDVNGFVMPDMLQYYQPFRCLIDAALRHRYFPRATWATALAGAASLARLIADLHAGYYVAGDIKPENLWTDEQGNVGICDVDSFQFADGAEKFLCRARSHDYTAPEGIDAPGSILSEHSDDFALAVLVYQLLMAGLHPFAGHPGNGTPYISVDDNILHGRAWIADPSSVQLIREAPPVSVLPRQLQHFFRQCFADSGRSHPEKRPSAAEWLDALESAQAPGQLSHCRAMPNHVYAAERPWCPWCEVACRGSNLYPSG